MTLSQILTNLANIADDLGRIKAAMPDYVLYDRDDEVFRLINDAFNSVSDAHDILSEDLADEYDDSMDGDHESALASVGWGENESYGDYGSYDEY